ncbi:testis-expressed protein 38 [Carettochelys insculpta]|uniref:testis-expressed protein 38 n=1 Tax=Carettochelys insculpta TaxID=44489 RepID=UPI003EBEBF85
MIIPSRWLPLYFVCLGLGYILIFISMFFFHGKKAVHREKRAKAWVELMQTETFFPNAVVHWANKRAHFGIKAEVCAPESRTSPKHNGRSLDGEGDTGNKSYKPVFQELPCARSLSSLPPLLPHSTSYPCSAIPSRTVPFSSLPDFMSRNGRCHGSSGNSA